MTLPSVAKRQRLFELHQAQARGAAASSTIKRRKVQDIDPRVAAQLISDCHASLGWTGAAVKQPPAPEPAREPAPEPQIFADLVRP